MKIDYSKCSNFQQLNLVEQNFLLDGRPLLALKALQKRLPTVSESYLAAIVIAAQKEVEETARKAIAALDLSQLELYALCELYNPENIRYKVLKIL